ncbi:hypothetical protein [Pedobacter sp. JY14-1]|uniref:hypothetical protein n=1 Tax=Pedobacter sp. JY14-1 TaxID=3034151 RepID=UPI0023E26685|nr:hypothetical protein [Pedobacter sp. JY14-1]
MKKHEILIVCAHTEILNTILRLINSNESLHGTGANTLEQAITTFTSSSCDLVLIGAGLSETEEQELESIISRSRKKVPVVHHYGGGSGLLFTEIYGALGVK